MTEQTVVYPKCTKCGKMVLSSVNYWEGKPYCLSCFLKVRRNERTMKDLTEFHRL